MDVQFKIDSSALQKTLRSLQTGLVNFEQPFKGAKDLQLREVQKNFNSEGGDISGKWKPLKGRTIAQRIAMGFGPGPILQRTGKLKKSIKQQSLTPNKLVIGSDAKYFEFHQVGTKKTPIRQMLGHSKNMISRVVDIFSRYINNLILHG